MLYVPPLYTFVLEELLSHTQIPEWHGHLKKLLRYRSYWQIIHNRIISFIVLSSDNTNCKNDIQLFHQLFDELSVYRDYH